MNKNLKRLAYLVIIPVVVITLLLFPIQKSNAGTLSAAYLMFTRMQANLTATDNIEIYIAFEPTGAIASGSTLTLEFPDAGDTNWCRTASTDLVATGVATTPADSSGAYVIDSSAGASLSASCTQGAGAGSADTITVTGLDALSAGITYGLKVSNGTTAKLGTGSAGSHIVTLTVTQGATIETMTFGVNMVSDDQVDVTATVVDVQTVTCSLGSNAVNLGNLYKGGSYVIGSHIITTSTGSSASGYYWAVYGRGNGTTSAGLWKSDATTYLIASDNSLTTVDISTPGSEGFGMNTSLPTDTVGGAGFSGNPDGVFGSIGFGSDNAELLLYQLGPQGTSEDATITYGARAGDTAEAGAYSETVTFVCGGYY